MSGSPDSTLREYASTVGTIKEQKSAVNAAKKELTVELAELSDAVSEAFRNKKLTAIVLPEALWDGDKPRFIVCKEKLIPRPFNRALLTSKDTLERMMQDLIVVQEPGTTAATPRRTQASQPGQTTQYDKACGVASSRVMDTISSIRKEDGKRSRKPRLAKQAPKGTVFARNKGEPAHSAVVPAVQMASADFLAEYGQLIEAWLAARARVDRVNKGLKEVLAPYHARQEQLREECVDVIKNDVRARVAAEQKKQQQQQQQKEQEEQQQQQQQQQQPSSMPLTQATPSIVLPAPPPSSIALNLPPPVKAEPDEANHVSGQSRAHTHTHTHTHTHAQPEAQAASPVVPESPHEGTQHLFSQMDRTTGENPDEEPPSSQVILQESQSILSSQAPLAGTQSPPPFPMTQANAPEPRQINEVVGSVQPVLPTLKAIAAETPTTSSQTSVADSQLPPQDSPGMPLTQAQPLTQAGSFGRPPPEEQGIPDSQMEVEESQQSPFPFTQAGAERPGSSQPDPDLTTAKRARLASEGGADPTGAAEADKPGVEAEAPKDDEMGVDLSHHPLRVVRSVGNVDIEVVARPANPPTRIPIKVFPMVLSSVFVQHCIEKKVEPTFNDVIISITQHLAALVASACTIAASAPRTSKQSVSVSFRPHGAHTESAGSDDETESESD